MNIASLLVYSRPETVAPVTQRLVDLPGVEIHATGGDGVLVVTVEETESSSVTDGVLRVHEVEGVLGAAMVYHYNDESVAHSTSQEVSHETNQA